MRTSPLSIIVLCAVLYSATPLFAQNDNGPLTHDQHDMVEHLRDAIQKDQSNRADHDHQPLNQQQNNMIVQLRDALRNNQPTPNSAVNNSNTSPERNPTGNQSQVTVGPNGVLYGMQDPYGQAAARSEYIDQQLAAQLAGLAIMQANDIGQQVVVSNQYGTAVGSPYGSNYSQSIQDQTYQVVAQSPVGAQMAAQLAAQALMQAQRTGQPATVNNQYGTATANPIAPPPETQHAIKLLMNSEQRLNQLKALPQNANLAAQMDLRNAAMLSQNAQKNLWAYEKQIMIERQRTQPIGPPPPGGYYPRVPQ